MINAVLTWSILNRKLVLLLTLLVSGLGVFAVKNTSVDAIPDLSDVQVIVKTRYPGQAPQIVEDQVTYPLSQGLLAVPGAAKVRGFSFFGDSYVYVLFDEGTDLYWARSRVMEYLNQIESQLPSGVKPALGPDATGVGWVYLYALTDPSGTLNLAELRSLQDWFLKFELQSVPGVAEVASIGGMVKEYQVTVDPEHLRALQIPLSHVAIAIEQASREKGASVIELAEAEYMVRVTARIEQQSDLNSVPLGIVNNGTPLFLSDIATIREGPAIRRGIAELNGEGEVVGGIIVMRHGENAQVTINAVKQKLESLKKGLPPGVEIVPVYDRSTLIARAIHTLKRVVLEEFLIVALICAVFLFHARSALVAIISLPVGMGIAFIFMYLQGINANIMSLGGIAIAIGAMIDGAVVMTENLHKHLERDEAKARPHWETVLISSKEVGPALFFSLAIVTISFFPVFSLEAQEGRMFHPLAYTKTYSMAAAALLAITLVPVLLGYFVRGNLRKERDNPVNRWCVYFYSPLVKFAIRSPLVVLFLAACLVGSALWPMMQRGTEFMPDFDEGDLMYMPSTYPGVSIGEARRILQQTDKLIASVPEVESVFGKIGRADTATDPAPLTMIETFIQFKPQSEWREGISMSQIRKELEQKLDVPGLSNAWVMPIKTRLDMLATGIKTPIGVKISGPDLDVIAELGARLESLLEPIPGTESVYSERVNSGRYIQIDIDRVRAAKYGVTAAELDDFIQASVGGRIVSESVEGRERYKVRLRFPEEYRDSPHALGDLPVFTAQGQYVPLNALVDIRIEDGPAAIKSENGRLSGWVLVDVEGRDLGSYVDEAKIHVQNTLSLPAGYALEWTGQYEYMERAKQTLSYVVPMTLLVITILLFMCFNRIKEVLIVLGTLPIALVGGLWLIHVLDFDFSVSVAVGFIAASGVSVELCVLMLLYLNRATAELNQGQDCDNAVRHAAIMSGAIRRIRPIMMTALSIILGMLPILLSDGTGSELMKGIAAPMIGGMITAVFLVILVLPAIYCLVSSHSAR